MFQFGVGLRAAERDYALMRGVVRCAVERFARFEAQWDASFSGRVDDLLQARTTRSASDQDAIERAFCPKRLAHWMDAGQHSARPGRASLGTRSSVVLRLGL